MLPSGWPVPLACSLHSPWTDSVMSLMESLRGCAASFTDDKIPQFLTKEEDTC